MDDTLLAENLSFKKLREVRRLSNIQHRQILHLKTPATMHLAYLTFLLGFLLTLCNAFPTPLSPTASMRTLIRPQYLHPLVRQVGCNQAQCDACRETADCTAGTPAW